MRKFLKRLVRFADLTIDLDGLIPPKRGFQPVQLKTIFDNLRCYTVLAFLVVGVQFLLKSDAPSSVFAAYFIGSFTVFLFLLVFYQSAFIILATCTGMVAAFLSPRSLVVLRRQIRTNETAVKIAAIVLGLPVGIFSGSLFWAVGKAISQMLRSTAG